MGTRAERNKKDFVGVLEHSHREVMVPSHHHHQYPSSSSSLGYCSAGVSDPVFSASSNHAYTSSLGEMFSRAGSNSAAVSVADPSFTSSSSAFSEAQWQELERQRNIYNYMMASVPVPCELLTPFPNNPSITNNQDVTVAVAKLGTASNASNNLADMEPWRCKRTDGKKWRCSRSVIPDQKYCERHTHKSRPRSRKHVESSRTTKNECATTYPQFYGQSVSPFSAISTLPPPSSSNDHHRGLRWFMKEGDSVATLNPEIHETVQLKIGSSRELKRGFDYDLNFRQEEPLVDQSFGALEGLLSPNQTAHNQETRRFFVDEAMGSSLTLSMAGGAIEEAERTNQRQWVSHEGPSWVCSTTPGGPLAEALFLGVSNNPSTISCRKNDLSD